MTAPMPRLFALLLLACVGPALAASSTQLAVQGTITPSACEPSLSDEGNVDHGKISARDLSPTEHTLLPRASLRFEVVCEAATLFALRTLDNRAGSSAIHPTWHGLGTTPANENLGSAAFGLYAPITEAGAVRVIVSDDAGMSWHPAVILGHSTWTAFATADAPSQPMALKQVSAELRVYSTITRASDLTLSDEVPIDGSATLEVMYL